jgi:hypothetical protein
MLITSEGCTYKKNEQKKKVDAVRFEPLINSTPRTI